MIRLETNVLGAFLVKDGRIIAKRLFPRDPAKISSSLKAAEKSVCAEEEALLRECRSTGGKRVYVKKPSRFWNRGLDLEFLEDEGGMDVYSIAEEVGVSRRDVDDLILEVNLALTRESMKEVEEDQDIIQSVCCLDDMDNVINRLVTRLREWYSLHFPELDHLVESHDAYVRLVNDVGLRGNYGRNNTGLDPRLEVKVLECAADSMGAAWGGEEYAPVKSLAACILSLNEAKKSVEDSVERRMRVTAPNISALAGPLLGARIITLAGGLRRLSTLPAGTIQILGAEDAFFRFLKSGSKPPKHGVIFQLPEIRGAPREKRGKLARTFAAKIALASRADLFKGGFMGDRLRAEFDARVKSL